MRQALEHDWDSRWFLIAAMWLILPMLVYCSYITYVRVIPATIAVCGGGVPASAVLTQWSWTVGTRLGDGPSTPFREFDICCQLPEVARLSENHDVSLDSGGVHADSAQSDPIIGHNRASHRHIERKEQQNASGHAPAGTAVQRHVQASNHPAEDPASGQQADATSHDASAGGATRRDGGSGNGAGAGQRSANHEAAQLEGVSTSLVGSRTSVSNARVVPVQTTLPGAKPASTPLGMQTGLPDSKAEKEKQKVNIPSDISAGLRHQPEVLPNCCWCLKVPSQSDPQPLAVPLSIASKLPFLNSSDVGLRRRVALAQFIRAMHASLEEQDEAEQVLHVYSTASSVAGDDAGPEASAPAESKGQPESRLRAAARSNESRHRVLDAFRARIRLAFSFLEDYTPVQLSTMGIVMCSILIAIALAPAVLLVGATQEIKEAPVGFFAYIVPFVLPLTGAAYGYYIIFSAFDFLQASSSRLRALVFLLNTLRAPEDHDR